MFFFFIPDILAQNEAFLPAASLVLGLGAGGFRFIPCAFALARPLAFRPPAGSFPSFLVHAGDLAIISFIAAGVSVLTKMWGYLEFAVLAAAETAPNLTVYFLIEAVFASM